MVFYKLKYLEHFCSIGGLNMESNGIFREKSLQRVTAPEDLNNYIRVTTPSVWMLLTAVLLLLVGIGTWGIFGRLDTNVKAAVVCQDGTITAYVTEQDSDQIDFDQRVAVDGVECTVASVASKPQKAGECLDSYGMHCLNVGEDDWVYAVTLTGGLPDGVFAGKIAIESVRPISFVIG